MIHVNQIKFEEKDEWTKAFNRCSDYFQKAMDENLPEKERKDNYSMWVGERYMLESGAYNQR